MSVDVSPIGIAASRLMDAVVEEYGEATRIEAAAVLVDLSYEDDDGHDTTSVQWRFVNGEGKALSSAHALGIASILRSCLEPESERVSEWASQN